MDSEPNTPILASDPAGDQATMLAAKRGDERAFGILCRRHWPKVFAVALRYTQAPRQAILAAILLLPLLVLVAQQKSSLLIDGPQGQARVIQVQGKNYVEVDEVARIEVSDLTSLSLTHGSETQPEFTCRRQELSLVLSMRESRQSRLV